MSAPRTTTRSQTDPDPQPIMYDVQSAARLWGVTPRQVRRWISEGRIDRVKPAGPTGPVYITLAEIQRRTAEWTVKADI